ncbi:hypothetical protein VB773_16200 [Haloarculaceae archaeon H-GB2-1]|nr:hypothetical protein [Haloarculaceae archaeon H-GB11]MEA5408957.1 hypothetical protein [Haloarculaceae archaeon H-GB2-1]
MLDVIRDPAQGESRLPYLLSEIESESVETRLAASCALCLVAEANPTMRDYVVRRLIDRLDDDAPTEIVHTLDYFAAEYPHEIDDVLVDLEEEAEVRARRRMFRTGGGFARSDYVGPLDPDRRVRGRVPGREEASDPRRTYTDEDGENEAAEGDEDSTEASAEDESDDDRDREDVSDGTLTPRRVAELGERLSRVIANSTFESLDVLAARRQRRCADVYRTLGTIDGEEQAIGLNVFHLPDANDQAFVDDFRKWMTAWADVDDHPNVHTVYDWGGIRDRGPR